MVSCIFACGENLDVSLSEAGPVTAPRSPRSAAPTLIFRRSSLVSSGRSIAAQTPLLELPQELIDLIISFLRVQEYDSFRHTCRGLYYACYTKHAFRQQMPSFSLSVPQCIKDAHEEFFNAVYWKKSYFRIVHRRHLIDISALGGNGSDLSVFFSSAQAYIAILDRSNPEYISKPRDSKTKRSNVYFYKTHYPFDAVFIGSISSTERIEAVTIEENRLQGPQFNVRLYHHDFLRSDMYTVDITVNPVLGLSARFRKVTHFGFGMPSIKDRNLDELLAKMNGLDSKVEYPVETHPNETNEKICGNPSKREWIILQTLPVEIPGPSTSEYGQNSTLAPNSTLLKKIPRTDRIRSKLVLSVDKATNQPYIILQPLVSESAGDTEISSPVVPLIKLSASFDHPGQISHMTHSAVSQYAEHVPQYYPSHLNHQYSECKYSNCDTNYNEGDRYPTVRIVAAFNDGAGGIWIWDIKEEELQNFVGDYLDATFKRDGISTTKCIENEHNEDALPQLQARKLVHLPGVKQLLLSPDGHSRLFLISDRIQLHPSLSSLPTLKTPLTKEKYKKPEPDPMPPPAPNDSPYIWIFDFQYSREDIATHSCRGSRVKTDYKWVIDSDGEIIDNFLGSEKKRDYVGQGFGSGEFRVEGFGSWGLGGEGFGNGGVDRINDVIYKPTVLSEALWRLRGSTMGLWYRDRSKWPLW